MTDRDDELRMLREMLGNLPRRLADVLATRPGSVATPTGEPQGEAPQAGGGKGGAWGRDFNAIWSTAGLPGQIIGGIGELIANLTRGREETTQQQAADPKAATLEQVTLAGPFPLPVRIVEGGRLAASEGGERRALPAAGVVPNLPAAAAQQIKTGIPVAEAKPAPPGTPVSQTPVLLPVPVAKPALTITPGPTPGLPTVQGVPVPQSPPLMPPAPSTPNPAPQAAPGLPPLAQSTLYSPLPPARPTQLAGAAGGPLPRQSALALPGIQAPPLPGQLPMGGAPSLAGMVGGRAPALQQADAGAGGAGGKGADKNTEAIEDLTEVVKELQKTLERQGKGGEGAKGGGIGDSPAWGPGEKRQHERAPRAEPVRESRAAEANRQARAAGGGA